MRKEFKEVSERELFELDKEGYDIVQAEEDANVGGYLTRSRNYLALKQGEIIGLIHFIITETYFPHFDITYIKEGNIESRVRVGMSNFEENSKPYQIILNEIIKDFGSYENYRNLYPSEEDARNSEDRLIKEIETRVDSRYEFIIDGVRGLFTHRPSKIIGDSFYTEWKSVSGSFRPVLDEDSYLVGEPEDIEALDRGLKKLGIFNELLKYAEQLKDS